MDRIKLNFIEIRTFGSRVGSNYIGITKNGTLSLYSGFYKKNRISDFKKCLLLYDKEYSILGIQFGGDNLGNGAFVINHNTKNKTGSISARNMFRLYNELSPAELKGRYVPVPYEDEARENVFMINLNEKVN